MLVENQLVRLLCTLMDTYVCAVCRIKLIINQMEQLKSVITDIDETKFFPNLINLRVDIQNYLLSQINLV